LSALDPLRDKGERPAGRLDAIFSRGRKVVIAYLCIGDPSVEESIALGRACIRAGADVLEVGVPFSDPTADGPAIARASHRAISHGGGLKASLLAAREIRASNPNVGLVLFGYYNPLFVRGETRAAREAAEGGIDALLVVDLPVEESAPLCAAASSCGIGIVPLLAPTSRAERVRAAAEVSKHCPTPFVYYVSVTGVTGSRVDDAGDAGLRAADLSKQLGRPVVVGFGIDSRDKAKAAAMHASGIVVGTALVRAIEQRATAGERQSEVERIIRELRAGVDEA
jgi:tryptophan synthase alpha chain